MRDKYKDEGSPNRNNKSFDNKQERKTYKISKSNDIEKSTLKSPKNNSSLNKSKNGDESLDKKVKKSDKRSFSSLIHVDDSELDQAKILKEKFDKSIYLSTTLLNVTDENKHTF